MQTTMIQVKKETADRLKMLKDYGRQSYDEIINKLLNAVSADELTAEDIKEIKQGLNDIKTGRIKPLEQVAKEIGIRLRG